MASNTKDSTRQNHRSVALAASGVAVLLVVLFIVAFVGGWLGSRAADDNTTAQSSDQLLNESDNDGNRRVTTQEASIAAVAEKVGASVVSINTSTADYARGQILEGAGTGMIISKNGYVMTNKHVVGNARSVTVTTENGRVFEKVPVIGSDKLNDIAFLKIDNVSDLPAVTFGNSATVRVGQQVVAIGNALGQFQNTVTSGIISGKGRPVTAATDETGSGSETLTDLLQTDAAINSGNSGGPLLNLDGQVIGINTAIAADAQNIGFAIPVQSTKGMIRELLASGKVQRAYLGVGYVSITPETKAYYELPVSKGDYVVNENGRAVASGSPADQAGIKDGDIITRVNDSTVGNGSSVGTLIGQYRVGETVQLTIMRDGKEMTKSVRLSAY